MYVGQTLATSSAMVRSCFGTLGLFPGPDDDCIVSFSASSSLSSDFTSSLLLKHHQS